MYKDKTQRRIIATPDLSLSLMTSQLVPTTSLHVYFSYFDLLIQQYTLLCFLYYYVHVYLGYRELKINTSPEHIVHLLIASKLWRWFFQTTSLLVTWVCIIIR